MPELGLVSVSFRELTPVEVMDAAKNAHLTCIEWGSDVHAPCDQLENLHFIAEEQKKRGLSCCSYGTYFRFGENRPEELKQYIKAAKILGTSILRLWCGQKASAKYTEEERNAAVEDCREAARIAEENQVILCMECHPNTLTDTKESALYMMEKVHSPAFRMYYQPNQNQTPEENIAYARLLSPYTYHVHVFNWFFTPDGVFHQEPLKNAVDIWKKYLEMLPGERKLLLEFMPDGKVSSLPGEAEALKEIAGGMQS